MAPEKEPKIDKDLTKNLATLRNKLAPAKQKLPPNWLGVMKAKPETPEVKEAREASRRREADQIALDLIKEKEPGLLEKIKPIIKAAIEFLDKNPSVFLTDSFSLELENTNFDQIKAEIEKALEEKSSKLGINKEVLAGILGFMVVDMSKDFFATTYQKIKSLKKLGKFRKVSINYSNGNINFHTVDNQGNQETILAGPLITAEKIDKAKKDLQAFLEVLS